jgi:hypothetical protein
MTDLIDRFCSVPARRQLYADVSSHTPIDLTPSNDDGWSSKTDQGRTTIFYAGTDHPEACLAHELLHAKLKCHGYEQYCTAICLTRKHPFITRVLEILDNELQHHKFYAEFLALGFEPSQMYHDSDSEVGTQLRQSIAALQSQHPPQPTAPWSSFGIAWLHPRPPVSAPQGSIPCAEGCEC